jgi:XTP/dITP diphosphohydrolase
VTPQALRLVLASNNAKKLAELQALLSDTSTGLTVQLVAQGALGITEAEEPHHTFIENALAKARHAAAAAAGPALADDSGLCVDALGGAPGVASAHYAPWPAGVAQPADREALRRAQDAANNSLLLQHMQGAANRRCAFVCTLVAVRHAQDPEPLVAVGRWVGELLAAPQGSHGFGYDPLMWLPQHGIAAAQMPAELKNQVSHRALAAAHMRGLMQAAWQLPAPGVSP